MEENDFKVVYNLSKFETCHKILCDLEDDALTDTQMSMVKAARVNLHELIDQMVEHVTEKS